MTACGFAVDKFPLGRPLLCRLSRRVGRSIVQMGGVHIGALPEVLGFSVVESTWHFGARGPRCFVEDGSRSSEPCRVEGSGIWNSVLLILEV